MRLPSKHTWMVVLLTVSLAANAVWIIRTFFPGKVPAGVTQHTRSSRLGLRPDQRKEVRRLMADFRLTQLDFKQKILNKRIQIIEKLGDPDLEPNDLSKQVDELNELENQLNQRYVITLARLGDMLNPGQRMRFLLRLSRSWFFQNNQGYRNFPARRQ